MPRPAWLATGASVGALALDLAPSPLVLVLCAAAGLAVSVALLASARAGARPALVQLETEPPALVAATLPWYPPVVPGDRIELRGRIRPPPAADDYGAYLERIGAVGTLRAESISLAPADGADVGSLAASLEALRRSASDGLSRAMPEPEAGLAAGVLIGLRD